MCLMSLLAAHMNDDQNEVIGMYDMNYAGAHSDREQASNGVDRTFSMQGLPASCCQVQSVSLFDRNK